MVNCKKYQGRTVKKKLLPEICSELKATKAFENLDEKSKREEVFAHISNTT